MLWFLPVWRNFQEIYDFLNFWNRIIFLFATNETVDIVNCGFWCLVRVKMCFVSSKLRELIEIKIIFGHYSNLLSIIRCPSKQFNTIKIHFSVKNVVKIATKWNFFTESVDCSLVINIINVYKSGAKGYSVVIRLHESGTKLFKSRSYLQRLLCNLQWNGTL